MATKKHHHIELISPISWTLGVQSGEMVAEFEAATPEIDNLILSIPLHEDFFDFAKEYCKQYKEYIQNKIK